MSATLFFSWQGEDLGNKEGFTTLYFLSMKAVLRFYEVWRAGKLSM